MAKIVLIYASMSGNTEMMAEAVADGIKEAGEEVEAIDIMNGVFAKDLLNYDGIILGSYTWGDGELPDDYLDFYEELEGVDLSGKKAAVFGSGDTGYNSFCAAVDILMEKLKERGADVYAAEIKVDLTPSEADEDECRTLGKNFVTFLNGNRVK
ncbi:flavodoxin [Bacillus benzoevorans]|uniref:Flavodoxin n=1 Tax=Bacillus benzoevorans TaxID=1456 RepID=A0A7X0HP17_9BACI|nr:flavodoxin [Bacillus benzoevorans]MBB6444228.1 flavodoxin I [Bacillus benzoevorans]